MNFNLVWIWQYRFKFYLIERKLAKHPALWNWHSSQHKLPTSVSVCLYICKSCGAPDNWQLIPWTCSSGQTWSETTCLPQIIQISRAKGFCIKKQFLAVFEAYGKCWWGQRAMRVISKTTYNILKPKNVKVMPETERTERKSKEY